MIEARDLILSRVRGALGAGSTRGDAGMGRSADRPTAYARPEVSGDLVERFAAQLVAAAGTLARAETDAEVPAAVGAYLDQRGLPKRLAVAPALQDMSWPAEWEVRFGPSSGADRVAVTPCFAAVAETGTLALLSGPDSPTTLNFLPDHHLVVAYAAQLVAHLEDLWERLRQHPQGMPRTLNLITGPSRTADVEQTLQLGAHGPLALHLILVGA